MRLFKRYVRYVAPFWAVNFLLLFVASVPLWVFVTLGVVFNTFAIWGAWDVERLIAKTEERLCR